KPTGRTTPSRKRKEKKRQRERRSKREPKALSRQEDEGEPVKRTETPGQRAWWHTSQHETCLLVNSPYAFWSYHGLLAPCRAHFHSLHKRTLRFDF
ncbi:unnamed protein product, partial [Ectocarpus sp. 13 AM-2016]